MVRAVSYPRIHCWSAVDATQTVEHLFDTRVNWTPVARFESAVDAGVKPRANQAPPEC